MTDLKMFISSNDQGVRIDFERKVAWIGMSKLQAVKFAGLILEHCGAVLERVPAAPVDGQEGDLEGSNGQPPKA